MSRKLSPRLWIRAGAALLCVVAVALLCVATAVGSTPQPQTQAAATPDELVVAPAPAKAPARPAVPLHTLVIVSALAAAGIAALGMASTTFGANDGYWHVAGNWSNGIPTTALSAIISSTGGIPVLSESTSAVASNISGGGTIGLAGGGATGANSVKISRGGANLALRFACVDTLVDETLTSTKPKGHG